jgi:hypothetical protein
MLEGTKHGKIFAEVDNMGLTSYSYSVDPGYLGKDKAVFMAEFEGKRYKVVVNFVITEGIDENSPQCPPGDGTLIKLNPKPVSGSSGYDMGSIFVAIANLPKKQFEPGPFNPRDLIYAQRLLNRVT